MVAFQYEIEELPGLRTYKSELRHEEGEEGAEGAVLPSPPGVPTSPLGGVPPPFSALPREAPQQPMTTEYYSATTVQTRTTRVTHLKRPAAAMEAPRDESRSPPESPTQEADAVARHRVAPLFPLLTRVTEPSDDDAPVEWIPETRATPLPTAQVQTVVSVQSERVVPRDQILHAASVVHPVTGRGMPLQDAVRTGLVDLPATAFVNPETKERTPFSEAAKDGWVDPGLLKQLQTRSGLKDPASGKELSVLEAVRRKMLDPVSGKVTDPQTGSKMALREAVERDVVAMDAAFTLCGASVVSSSTLETRGFFDVSSVIDTGVTLRLTEALEQGLYDPDTGKIMDPVAQDEMTISAAIQNGFLDKNAQDIIHPASGERLSLEDAVAQGILDPDAGVYVDPRSGGRRVTLDEAASRGLLLRPVSLRGAVTQGLLDPESGLILDSRTGRKFPLPEAIDSGVLDAEAKCILDPATKTLVSVREAMESGRITYQAQCVDPRSGASMSVQVGLDLGRMCSQRALSHTASSCEDDQILPTRNSECFCCDEFVRVE